MSDDIIRDIEEIFEITEDSNYEFRKHYGFTFVFRTRILVFKDRMSSAEIAPVGMIYEENGEYFFAPLANTTDLEEIVKEYVENCMISQ